MSRSHPPSLLRLVERLARDEGLFARGEIVLCACSGGPDSTALLHALALLRKRVGHEVVAHGVDHGLRPEAAAELALAQQVAASVGVPFAITQLQVEPGGNLQARARTARLQALAAAAAAAGAVAIATGHTADDRAETWLLRLLRGSGPRGLAVLPPMAPFPVPLPESLAERAPMLIRPCCAPAAPTCSRTSIATASSSRRTRATPTRASPASACVTSSSLARGARARGRRSPLLLADILAAEADPLTSSALAARSARRSSEPSASVEKASSSDFVAADVSTRPSPEVRSS